MIALQAWEWAAVSAAPPCCVAQAVTRVISFRAARIPAMTEFAALCGYYLAMVTLRGDAGVGPTYTRLAVLPWHRTSTSRGLWRWWTTLHGLDAG